MLLSMTGLQPALLEQQRLSGLAHPWLFIGSWKDTCTSLVCVVCEQMHTLAGVPQDLPSQRLSGSSIGCAKSRHLTCIVLLDFAGAPALDVERQRLSGGRIVKKIQQMRSFVLQQLSLDFLWPLNSSFRAHHSAQE